MEMSGMDKRLPELSQREFRTSLLAGRVMAAAAESVSRMADGFSNWMLGGFGAVLALLLANVDRLSSIITVATLRRAGLIYVVAAALGVAEKIMALWCGGAAKGAATGAQLTKDFDQVDLDLSLYINTTERGLLRIWRWLFKRALAALANGDITYIERTALKTAQWQVVVVALEAVLVVIAATVLVSSL